MTPPLKNNSQSGNILIYILGAIFLLGLLVVISKGSVTPGAGIDQETLMIRVSEVQAYGQELERAVAYVMANGHSETDIRFAHPDASSAYGDITDVPSRQIFSRAGGGATYRTPPEGIQVTPTDWLFTGKNKVQAVGTDSGDTSGDTNSTDLLAILSNVSKPFCIEINKKNGIDNPLNNPPQDVNIIYLIAPFNGHYGLSATLGRPTIQNKLEGCFEGDVSPPAGTYHYYRVLLAR